jgi:hypothetical protein
MEPPTPDTFIVNAEEMDETWQVNKITSGSALSDQGNYAMAMVLNAAKIPELGNLPVEDREKIEKVLGPPSYRNIALIIEDPMDLIALWHTIGFQIFVPEAWERIIEATLTDD